jgi:hypothetical protein
MKRMTPTRGQVRLPAPRSLAYFFHSLSAFNRVGSDDDAERIAHYTTELEALASAGAAAPLSSLHVTPLVFEKDDDTNHHIAFMTAAANIRAHNYALGSADFQKVGHCLLRALLRAL